MKKGVIVLFLFTLIFLINNNQEEFIIPDNAIRLRVIANSNTFEDQATKMEIKNNIESILKTDLMTVDNKQEATNIVNNKMKDIKDMMNHYNIKYNINYGNNYFPEKNYKGVTYKEGMYESLVVTLGTGKGDNWWCVLFPPLCLMEATTSDMEDVEYQFFVKEMIEKYL